jgi:RNA polymerase sigma factor (sigma-70 family)
MTLLGALFFAFLPVSAGDTALVREALAGDLRSRRALVNRLTPVVRARALRVLRSRAVRRLDEVDDVVQSVWLVLWKDDGRQLRAWSPDRGISLEAYVGMITERETGNHLQRVTALRRGESQTDSFHAAGPSGRDDLEVAAPGASPEQVVEADDLTRALEAHLSAELSEKGRLVLALVYVDGRSPEEAARLLGVQLQVVYNWQHKIRGLARDFLALQAQAS